MVEKKHLPAVLVIIYTNSYIKNIYNIVVYRGLTAPLRTVQQCVPLMPDQTVVTLVD